MYLLDYWICMFEMIEFWCRPAGPNSVSARQLCSRDPSLTHSALVWAELLIIFLHVR